MGGRDAIERTEGGYNKTGPIQFLINVRSKSFIKDPHINYLFVRSH